MPLNWPFSLSYNPNCWVSCTNTRANLNTTCLDRMKILKFQQEEVHWEHAQIAKDSTSDAPVPTRPMRMADTMVVKMIDAY